MNYFLEGRRLPQRDAHTKREADGKADGKDQNNQKGDGDLRDTFMDVAAYWALGASVIPFTLFGVFYSSHKTPSIILFGIGVLCLTIAGCLYWINAVTPPPPTIPPVLTTDNKENPPMPDKPEDNKPFISQHIGDGSPGASNTIGNVTYNAAPPDRHLTAEQRSRLIILLSQGPKGLVDVVWVGDEEARGFALELSKVLSGCGWTVNEVAQGFFAGSEMKGISFSTADTQAIPPLMNVLYQAFSNVGLAAQGNHDPNKATGTWSLIIGRNA